MHSFIPPVICPFIPLPIHSSIYLSSRLTLLLIHSPTHPFIPKIFVVWTMCPLGFSSRSNEVRPHWTPRPMACSFASLVFPRMVHRGAGRKPQNFYFYLFLFLLKISSLKYMFYNKHNVLIPCNVYSFKLHAQKYCKKGQNPEILETSAVESRVKRLQRNSGLRLECICNVRAFGVQSTKSCQ